MGFCAHPATIRFEPRKPAPLHVRLRVSGAQNSLFRGVHRTPIYYVCVSVTRRGLKACVNRTPFTMCVIKTVHVRIKKCAFLLFVFLRKGTENRSSDESGFAKNNNSLRSDPEWIGRKSNGFYQKTHFVNFQKCKDDELESCGEPAPDLVNVFILYRIKSLNSSSYGNFENGIFGHDNGSFDKFLCYNQNGSFRISRSELR